MDLKRGVDKGEKPQILIIVIKIKQANLHSVQGSCGINKAQLDSPHFFLGVVKKNGSLKTFT